MNPTDPTQAPAPQAAPSPVPPVPTFPEDYEELRRFRAEYEPTLQAIAPYLDDIAPIVQDETYREFSRSARSTWQQQQEARKPQIDPTLQPVVDRFESQLGPVVEYVNSERAARAKSAADEAESAKNANIAYAQRLIAERPDLAEDNFAGIGMLASYAHSRGISVEEAWKRKGGALAAPVAKVEPPRSLRGDAAAPGVPGESAQRPIKSQSDLRNRLASNLRAAGMK